MSRVTCFVNLLVFGGALSCNSAAAYGNNEKEPLLGTVSAGVCELEVQTKASTPDFDPCNTYNLRGGYQFTHRYHVEAGYQYYSGTSTSMQTDLAGSYKTQFAASTIYSGIGAQFTITDTLRPYIRAGMSYYRGKLTVDEYFDDVYPEGSQSARDNGLGYYWAAGLSLQMIQNMRFTLEYQQQILPEVFSDSSRPFDVRYNSIMFGVGF